ncbi:hypothetical protein FPZ42_11355 [Mucilaginibacter achroorhodeus]|uniref:Lipocalin-like domain-containing protein n=1 Tax=Mucilaginibacter achroorhodeus TaxID=2599294 RepID=A0A563U4D4_9SPHI|nr:hypothetical protein [Mucilaginibacter achroorhodeus]TWR26216.1 hypothetical protein FPZ42_11355 [Mucilaginibacter achroorhodeus]
MKKILLATLLAVSLFACKKITTNNPAPANGGNDDAAKYPLMLASKWQQTADTTRLIDSNTVVNTNGKLVTDVYYQFNINGTGEQINANSKTDLTYILNEKNIIITLAPGQSQQMIRPGTIRLLNANTLCLFFDDINANGSSKSTQVMWFKKVN